MTALAFVILLGSPSALADVVGPEPASCPDGSQPATHHGGPHCSPAECNGKTPCADGMQCAKTDLCIEVRKGYSRGGGFDFDHVVAPCGAGDACPDGSKCRARDVCTAAPAPGPASPPTPPAPGKKSNDGCSTVAGPGGAAALSWAALVALAGLRRRQTRPK